ncbi:MAG: hydrogenase-1 expression HyaE [Planctomycetota bacterium]
MFSPLMQSVLDREPIAVVTAENHLEFAQAHEHCVLMIPGDWKRHIESNDVAIILPELVKAFEGRLAGAVVDSASERDIQAQYRFARFPALVFLRRGEYLGVIEKVLDWQDYLCEISEILEREPRNPPAFEFPKGCAPTGESHE